MPTFLHAADLHLDSPLHGLTARDADVGTKVRNATRQAFRALVDGALAANVRFAVLAGDLFDDTHQSIDTALFLNAELGRLVERGVGVYLIRGNHDHLARPSAVLLPRGVVQMPSERATTELRPDLGVAIHGQSFGEQRVENDLTDAYPLPVRGLLNVGLLHTALEGRSGSHARYAPTSAGKLASRGYEYWALGHVHGRDVFRERDAHIAYPGNLQGRHINERGAKGALLVDWEGTTIQAVRPLETDVLRWHEVVVELDRQAHRDDQLRSLADQVADATRETRLAGKLAAVRIIARGAGIELAQCSRDELRGLVRQTVATSAGEGVLLEEIRLEASVRVELPRSLEDPIERLSSRLERGGGGDALRFAKEMWDKVNESCGPELAPRVWQRLDVTDVEGLRRLLVARGRERLLAHLGEGLAMRLVRLDCARVGRWPTTSLSFSPGLTIVYGPNEAGKSTALRAVEAMLFPLTTEELRPLVAPCGPTQFDATIHLERDAEQDGTPIVERIAWRRAGKALLDEAGRPLGPEIQHAWLWETSRQDFRALYALDDQRLRDHTSLLGKNNTLGRVLAEIAAGGRDLVGVQMRLQSELEKRYTARGRNRLTLTAALGKVAEASDRMKAADRARAHATYAAAVETSQRAHEAERELDRNVQAKRSALGEIDRLLFAPPAFAELGALEETRDRLRASGTVPTPAWADTIRTLRERRTSIRDELTRAATTLEETRRALEGRLPSAVVLDREDRLVAALDDRALLLEAPARRARLEEAFARASRTLEQALESMGLGTVTDAHEPGQNAARVPPESARLALAKAWKAVAEADETERTERLAAGEAEARKEEQRAAVQRLGTAIPLGALRALQAEVGEHAPAAARRTREAALAERARELHATGTRLGLPQSASLEEQRALRVPAEEALSAIRGRFDETTQAHRRAETRAGDAREKAQLAEREVSARAAALPPAAANADLTSARQRRAEAWHALRLIETDEGANAAARAPHLLAYEGAARALDETVDAVLRHAEAVAQLAELRRSADDLRTAVTAAEQHRKQAHDDREAVRDEWAALWFPTQIAPPAIEHLGFGREHARFVTDVDNLLAERATLAAEDAAADDARARLEAGLRAFGLTSGPNEGLAGLLERLDELVTTSQRHDAAWQAATTATNKAEADEARAKTRLARATEASVRARAELARTTEEIALPAATREDADKLARWLSEGKALPELVRARGEAAASLADHDREHQQRLARLTETVDALANGGVDGGRLDDRDLSPLAHLQRLATLLTDARETRSREEARAKAEAAHAARERAELEWSTRWTSHLASEGLAGLAPDGDELAALLERVAAVQQAEQGAGRIRAQLALQAQMSLEALEAKLAGRSDHALQAERSALVDEISALEARRHAAQARTIEVDRALAELGTIGEHDLLRQERESALTLLVDELTETITLKGATLLLGELQAELAQTDQRAALLSRASATLAKLTGGAFGQLHADDEDASLSVSRAGDDQPLGMEALSAGTRDQVMLALRLAVTQRQLTQKRLPFVLDDVLVHFDDARAACALSAFAELAEHTQVILFTHHRHLLDLARTAGIAFHGIELAPPTVEPLSPNEEEAALDATKPLPRAPRKPRTVPAEGAQATVELLAIAPEDADDRLLEKLLELGGSAGNGKLRSALGWDEAVYEATKASLVAAHRLELGKGRGGSVKLPATAGLFAPPGTDAEG